MTSVADRRAAAARLAEALRALSAAAVLSEVPAGELEAVADDVKALTARLAATSRPAGGLASVDDLTAGIRMFNPVSGVASPFAPPVHYQSGDADVAGRVTLGPGFEGHAGYAHGGTVALLFDDALGTAASRRVWPSVTSRLVTRYLRPVPVGLPLLIRAAVAEAEGRRMTVRGTLSTEADPGLPLATGEAVFVELGREQAIAMLGADLRRVHGRPIPADYGVT